MCFDNTSEDTTATKVQFNKRMCYIILQAKQMKFKDERIKLMNDVLNGIKVNGEIHIVAKSFRCIDLDLKNELKVDFMTGQNEI
jgi:hypothetical protein